ncbi:hypothetical protein U9M48_000263 [Paspalum notatum var. saurae]|uniref:Uncharacterized protein n=1 Tax=Paspalum notatum var. saurae TaxID=547442 RepID=A0AAQ3SCA9_PASNO
MVAVFNLMTIADFSDQYTDYQDKLFAKDDGRLEFRGNTLGTKWPGSGKPGLWMNAMSRLAALCCLIARGVDLVKLLTGGNDNDAAAAAAGEEEEEDASSSLELVIPPVFDHCTVSGARRDLYWQVASGDEEADATRVEAQLRESIEWGGGAAGTSASICWEGWVSFPQPRSAAEAPVAFVLRPRSLAPAPYLRSQHCNPVARSPDPRARAPGGRRPLRAPCPGGPAPARPTLRVCGRRPRRPLPGPLPRCLGTWLPRVLQSQQQVQVRT